MSKVLTNLTKPTVVGVIEDVLEAYPSHPYQQAFAIPDMHQKLIAFVLSRIQNVYGVIEEPGVEDALGDAVPFHTEERMHVEAVVHQGIHTVFEENPFEVQTQIPTQEEAGLGASHWFG
jgi:hypothetical protein